MKSKNAIGLVAAAGLAVSLVQMAAAGPEITPLVLTGEAAPGQGAGVTFGFVSSPRVGDSGLIAFHADLAGDGIDGTNDGSIWSNREGTPFGLVVREGDRAPLAGEIRWGAFPLPVMNESGRFSFTATLVDTATPNAPTNLGIFAEDASMAVRPVAREGEALPGFEAGVSDRLLIAAFNDAGDVAFHGLRGRGLWSTRGGTLDLIARDDGAPWGGPADQFVEYLDSPVQLGDGGLVFRGSYSLPEQFPDYSWALYAEAGGVVTPFAATREAAPGAGPGVVFSELDIEPSVNGARQVAFWGGLSGDGVVEANDAGVWTGTTAAPVLRVREGDVAPGTGGAVFASFSGQIAQNEMGEIAFVAHLAGDGVGTDVNSGLFAASASGDPTLVAREGDAAARLPAGVVFAGFGDPAINDRGQLAFMARLAGPGTTMTTRGALYMTDRGGHLVPIVRTGDEIDIAGDGSDLRTVRDIIFEPVAPGGGVGAMNAAGEIAFKLYFTDLTSGLFISGVGCLVDINGDGIVNLMDFVAFRNLYTAGDLAADFDGNGTLTLADFVAFRNAYAAGCS